jgi:hypothetical protein
VIDGFDRLVHSPDTLGDALYQHGQFLTQPGGILQERGHVLVVFLKSARLRSQ